MKRRKRLKGFQKFRSEERLHKITLAWGYLPWYQQIRFALIILWQAKPTLYQIINHIKYFGRRRLERFFYYAHWIK